jgi:hypothetical protein
MKSTTKSIARSCYCGDYFNVLVSWLRLVMPSLA